MHKKMMIAGILTAFVGAGLPLGLSAADAPKKMSADEVRNSPVTATLELDVKQIGLIVGGQSGDGVLHFQGKDYPFTLKSLKVGAIVGATKSSATGDVRMLNKIEDFEGGYSAIGVGAAVGKGGDTSSFQNNKGVIFTLKQKSTGLGVDLGITAAEIKLKK